jgi:hypothetical protein
MQMFKPQVVAAVVIMAAEAALQQLLMLAVAAAEAPVTSTHPKALLEQPYKRKRQRQAYSQPNLPPQLTTRYTARLRRQRGGAVGQRRQQAATAA